MPTRSPDNLADTRTTLNHGALTVAVVMAVVLGVQWSRRDVNFCRAVFKRMASGRPSVEKHIGWEQLKAIGVDIGAEYVAFPNDTERADYRQAFIASFAKGFKSTGGLPGSFKNWRVVDRGAGTVTVAADYAAKGKTLLFDVSTLAGRHVVGIRWNEPAEPCATCGA